MMLGRCSLFVFGINYLKKFLAGRFTYDISMFDNDNCEARCENIRVRLCYSLAFRLKGKIFLIFVAISVKVR